MASYNIEMNMLNSSGSYDILYPKTLGSQVSGTVSSATNASNLTGSISITQVVGAVTENDIKTMTLYNNINFQQTIYLSRNTGVSVNFPSDSMGIIVVSFNKGNVNIGKDSNFTEVFEFQMNKLIFFIYDYHVGWICLNSVGKCSPAFCIPSSTIYFKATILSGYLYITEYINSYI